MSALAGSGMSHPVPAFAFTLLLAWTSFVVLKGLRPLILSGQGHVWAGLAGVMGAIHWPLQIWLDCPAAFPCVGTAVYLLSVIGLAPDDSVLERTATPTALWFQRGLIQAVAGTLAGMLACIWLP